MRDYSSSELLNLTRGELFALHAKIVAELVALPDNERPSALENLRKLRRALARVTLSP